MIKELGNNYPVQAVCEVLEATRSGYYRWCQGQASIRELANQQLVQQLHTIHEAKRGTYGSPRMTEELRHGGQKCNHKASGAFDAAGEAQRLHCQEEESQNDQ